MRYPLVAALACAAITISMAACGGYSKETVAIAREKVTTRIPNQQRLVALAVDDAIERLDFSQLAGKRVMTEISGIFPHSKEDVLDYIESAVEGKLARQGAQVVDRPASMVAAFNDSPNAVGAINLDPTVDYRLAIGVSWAGVDTHDKKSVDVGLLAKQIGVAVSGIVLGTLLAEDQPEIGSVLSTVGVGGGIAWYFFDKPEVTSRRLIGRVRLRANAIPMQSGEAFLSIGEGQTEIVIDPQSEEGYRVLSSGWF